MKHFSRKARPVLASVILSVPTEGYVGDPAQICLLVNAKDQYGTVMALPVTSWRINPSSPVGVASITVAGALTDLTEGSVDVQAEVGGGWWS